MYIPQKISNQLQFCAFPIILEYFGHLKIWNYHKSGKFRDHFKQEFLPCVPMPPVSERLYSYTASWRRDPVV